MRVPNKPGQVKLQNISDSRHGLLNAFAKEIVHGNVILLLGHESLLKIPTEEEASADENLSLLRNCEGSMERWMLSLKEIYYKDSDFTSLKEFFACMFDNDNIPQLDAGEMNPEIRNLLESKTFRIVLTTTYDPLIEEVMENAWGGKGSIEIKNFGDSQNRDLETLEKAILTDDIKPTLYYLFGKATNDVSNYGNPQFVVDEEDYIRFIREWMIHPPTQLMSYIAYKRILAIGCKFENWLFRFFWRAILEAKKNTDDFKHLLAISLSSSPEDQKLKEIFKLYNLKYPKDVSEFLRGLNTAIKQQKEQALANERMKGGIFLSYCSQNYDRVLNLFYKLKDLGFSVWMDSKNLSHGDEYKMSIKEAIDNCSVFVPILSKAISEHLPTANSYDENDENYHFYRDFEWNYAYIKYENSKNDKGGKIFSIVPFALEDYNPRHNEIPNEIKNLYPLIFEKTLASYDNVGFVKFIDTLKNCML